MTVADPNFAEADREGQGEEVGGEDQGEARRRHPRPQVGF